MLPQQFRGGSSIVIIVLAFYFPTNPVRSKAASIDKPSSSGVCFEQQLHNRAVDLPHDSLVEWCLSLPIGNRTRILTFVQKVLDDRRGNIGPAASQV